MPNIKRKPITRKKFEATASDAKIQSNSKKHLPSKRRIQIKSKEAYELVMEEIDKLMKRGEKNLNQKELVRLRTLAEAAEMFEDTTDPLPLPESLPEMIRMRMFQMQLNQSFAAKLLGVSDAKLSLIMSGKQKPDIYFLKALHDKLRVDANLIFRAL